MKVDSKKVQQFYQSVVKAHLNEPAIYSRRITENGYSFDINVAVYPDRSTRISVVAV